MRGHRKDASATGAGSCPGLGSRAPALPRHLAGPGAVLPRVLLAAHLLTLLPAQGFAGMCGDDIGGRRIPCRCGDTVVSDTTLRPGDPVVSARCHGDGLEIEAGALAETLILDLAGLSIVGSGAGVGIEANTGGSEGAVIIGGHDGRRGQVVAFNVGVRARNPRAIRRIEALDLKGNRREGLWLRTNGTMVIDVHAVRNGSDGLRVMGRGGRLIGVEARENGGSGLRSYAYDLIIDARAIGNKLHGIALSGHRNDLGGSVAEGNGGHGVIFTGSDHNVAGVTVRDNRLGGVTRRQLGVLR